MHDRKLEEGALCDDPINQLVEKENEKNSQDDD